MHLGILLMYLKHLGQVLLTFSKVASRAVLLLFGTDLQISNQTALIPRINDVDGGVGSHIAAGQGTLSIDMQNSINAAVFNSRVSNVSFVCPTGNCTFPHVYRSTGWCKTCADVSDQL